MNGYEWSAQPLNGHQRNGGRGFACSGLMIFHIFHSNLSISQPGRLARSQPSLPKEVIWKNLTNTFSFSQSKLRETESGYKRSIQGIHSDEIITHIKLSNAGKYGVK